MPTLRKRGNSWVLNWSENGRQHRVSLGAIAEPEARRILRAKETEIDTGIQILSYAPSFQDYANEYMTWYAIEYPSSYERVSGIIMRSLIPAFGSFALDHILPRPVEAWKASRLLYVKSETVAKELRTLKAMLNRAVEWQLISANPCATVRAPKNLDSKPPRWYTVEELRALYDIDEGHRYIWQFMANTGVRRSEAQNLRRIHVLTDRVRVLSETYARTKSGKWREIPLSPAAKDAIVNLGDDYLLPRMNADSLSRAFRVSAKRADIGGSLHCLRHTFCSHLVMAGVPLRTVQILAGHAHYSTTEKYSHLAPDYLVGALSGLSL